jgi:hypothetical protein
LSRLPQPATGHHNAFAAHSTEAEYDEIEYGALPVGKLLRIELCRNRLRVTQICDLWVSERIMLFRNRFRVAHVSCEDAADESGESAR